MSVAHHVIDALNEELVVRAEEIVRAMGQSAKGLGDVSKSQLARAVEVARSARSPRVFNNWLAYQAGRDQSREFWTHRVGDRRLIDAVRETLAFIEERMREESVHDRKLQQETVTEALVRFLGFLRRALVGWEYLVEGGRGR